MPKLAIELVWAVSFLSLILGVILAVVCMLIGAKLGRRQSGDDGPLFNPSEPETPHESGEYDTESQ